MPSDIQFHCFPRTKPPPPFALSVVKVFEAHAATISTRVLNKGLTSDGVLRVLAADLKAIGFEVETGKAKGSKIDRPVFFGPNGEPTLGYQIDGFHPGNRCGIEIEAGRAWMGNAIYRDLVQAMVMVDVDHLVLAVANAYKFNNKKLGKTVTSLDFKNAVEVADALYGHTRIGMPYGLTIIGY